MHGNRERNREEILQRITAPTSSVLTQLSTRDPQLVPLGIQRPKGQDKGLMLVGYLCAPVY